MEQMIEKQRNEFVDLLHDGWQVRETISDGNGGVQEVLVIDNLKAWYNLHTVASNTFGRMALELEMLRNLGRQCHNHMTKPMAEVLQKQIDEMVLAYMYSVDAKNSESRRDKHNTQSTLTDRMLHFRIEHQFTPKDEMKRSMLSGFLGKDKKEEEQ